MVKRFNFQRHTYIRGRHTEGSYRRTTPYISAAQRWFRKFLKIILLPLFCCSSLVVKIYAIDR